MLYEFADLAWLCFFFQAEDGIRDLVRSRGLGDVYKRQTSLRGPSNRYSPSSFINRNLSSVKACQISRPCAGRTTMDERRTGSPELVRAVLKFALTQSHKATKASRASLCLGVFV